MSDNNYNKNYNKSLQSRSAQSANGSGSGKGAGGYAQKPVNGGAARVSQSQKRTAADASGTKAAQGRVPAQGARSSQNSQGAQRRIPDASRVRPAQGRAGGREKAPEALKEAAAGVNAQRKASSQSLQRKGSGVRETSRVSDGEKAVSVRAKAASAAKKAENNAAEISEQDERLLKHKKRILRQTRRREQSLASFNIAVIITVFAFATLFMTFGKRSTVSVEEKRELAKMPKFTVESYLDGSFFDDFSEFYNDTVPMRGSFMSFISSFRGILGIKSADGVELIGGLPTIDKKPGVTDGSSNIPPTASLISSKKSSSTADKPPVETPQPTESATGSETQADPAGEPEELSDGVVVLSGGWGISLYGGGYSAGQNYANTLNKIKQAVGNDVNVYSLVSPTSGSFYLPAKYKAWMASESDNIDHINSYLDGVIPIDAYGALEKHKSEAIFARTDHHWNQLGAYYASEEFAKTAGVYFAPLSDYDSYSFDDHMGTMLTYSNYNATIANNPEEFTYYVPRNSYSSTMYGEYLDNPQASFVFYPPNLISKNSFNGCKDYYGVFFGGADGKAFRVKTDVENGRRLIVVKDSYGNAIVPCLTNSFEEIWLIDMRWFKGSVVQLAKDYGITDVLFAMNTFSATGPNQQKMADIQLSNFVQFEEFTVVNFEE